MCTVWENHLKMCSLHIGKLGFELHQLRFILFWSYLLFSFSLNISSSTDKIQWTHNFEHWTMWEDFFYWKWFFLGSSFIGKCAYIREGYEQLDWEKWFGREMKIVQFHASFWSFTTSKLANKLNFKFSWFAHTRVHIYTQWFLCSTNWIT